MTTADIFPAGISSPGNNTFILTDTQPAALADFDTGLDITCYMQATEMEITMEQDREDDTRACHASKSESFGATTFTRESIVHIVNPQGDGTEQGNLALARIATDSTLYVSIRMGIEHGGAPAASDKWDVYRVVTGEAHTSPQQSGKYVRRVMTSWSRIAQGVSFA